MPSFRAAAERFNSSATAMNVGSWLWAIIIIFHGYMTNMNLATATCFITIVLRVGEEKDDAWNAVRSRFVWQALHRRLPDALPCHYKCDVWTRFRGRSLEPSQYWIDAI